MDKKDILQFEADDTSKMGVNGKQVFVTKRINGKTMHYKTIDEENQKIINQKNKFDEENNDELFIEFKNLKFKEEPNKKQSSTKHISDHKNNKKKVSKAQRNKKRKKKILKIAFLLVLITGVIIFTLVSPIFNITNIEVKGNKIIDSSTIESLSGKQKGKNIFKINKKEIINKIKENQYISSVSIKRMLPGTLEITVSEREIAYQVKVIDSYIYIDYQGYILEVSSNSAKVPEIIGFSTDQDTLLNGKRISKDDIEKYINTLSKIKETAKSAEIWDMVSSITLENGEYIIKMNKEKKKVYLGKATDLTNMMLYVKVILEKEKGKTGIIFVNGELNNGFKPFFRENKK